MDNDIYIILNCIHNSVNSWDYIRYIPFLCKTSLSIFQQNIDKYLTKLYIIINKKIGYTNIPRMCTYIAYPNHALQKKFNSTHKIFENEDLSELSNRIIQLKNRYFIIHDDYYINHETSTITMFKSVFLNHPTSGYLNIIHKEKLIGQPYKMILNKAEDHSMKYDFIYIMLTDLGYYEFCDGLLDIYKSQPPHQFIVTKIIKSPINNVNNFKQVIGRTEKQ
jgi:hypothetical protein